MKQFSVTYTAGIAAFGALLALGGGAALSNQAPGPKSLPRVASAPVEFARPVQTDPALSRVVGVPSADCLAILTDAAEVGTGLIYLANGADMRVARIQVTDGSVTISCDRLAGRMTVTKNPAPAAVVASR